jgi:hypothetical protein
MYVIVTVIQHCFICWPSDSTVSEDAGIEPSDVATLALTARRSNQSAIPHPRTNIAIGLTEIYLIKNVFVSRVFNEFPRKLIKRLRPYCAVGVPADASAVEGISTVLFLAYLLLRISLLYSCCLHPCYCWHSC